MGLYDKKKEQPQNQALCFTGYTACDRIMLYIATGDSLHLGDKIFHCIRRFTHDCIQGQCNLCSRDMNRQCFKLKKEYFSNELIDILIQVYKDKASKHIGTSAIWWDNPKFNAIMNCINKPVEVKKDHYQILEDKEEKIF